MNLTTNEIRQRFLDFFASKDHALLESASLVTSDEKGVTDSTLFNTAGVQPLVPYLLGEKHPQGTRLASSQKCVRTIDIDEVGDKTHLTFFEMIGNWSLGDYFKEESIKWSYEFLTNKEKGLGLDPKRLYITVFGGNKVSEKDTEAADVWKKYIPENRIYFLEDNWWEAGDNGPCGPDTEMFYDLTEEGLGDMTHEEFIAADNNQKVVEIWNNVFMQFEKKEGEVIGKLPKHAVDTGAGLERLSIVVNKLDNVYETDNFEPIINLIEQESEDFDLSTARIIADHIKASTLMMSDGVIPSNTDRGYILRRLIRIAITKANSVGLSTNSFEKISEMVIEKYQGVYNFNVGAIKQTLNDEISKFSKTYDKALRELEKQYTKAGVINGEMLFNLETTSGLPKDLTVMLAGERNYKVEKEAFEVYEQLKKEHQEKSRTAAEGKFKGGLEGDGEITIKYHTATHLLQQALKDVLGDHVEQKGSNNNEERLRFDFTHPEKMTEEQKAEVEKIVNEKISANLPVKMVEMPKEKALETGAIHLFADKYGDTVSIYYIGDDLETAWSKEFCGGPHVSNTGELGKFRIKKEEASSSGVRRIKGLLE
jgi:alanyl-tRNA synthetase